MAIHSRHFSHIIRTRASKQRTFIINYIQIENNGQETLQGNKTLTLVDVAIPLLKRLVNGYH